MNTETKYTRSDYMAGACSHREYYAQFVTPAIRAEVLRSITRPVLLASKDEHLNDIPLQRWDNLSFINRPALAIDEGGQRVYSLAGGVCILKEAARQVIEEAFPMKTQFIQIPARSFQLDPQNKAHVAKLVRMAESAFTLAAKAGETGNNSGDNETMRLMNHRCDRKRAEAEAMLAPLGIKCSYPGLYPAFEVGGCTEYTVEAAVVAALKLPRNFLTA